MRPVSERARVRRSSLVSKRSERRAGVVIRATRPRTIRYMRRLLIGSVAAVAVFLLLALWNSAVAVVFGIAALTWILSDLYRWSVGGDMFGDMRSARNAVS